MLTDQDLTINYFSYYQMNNSIKDINDMNSSSRIIVKMWSNKNRGIIEIRFLRKRNLAFTN